MAEKYFMHIKSWQDGTEHLSLEQEALYLRLVNLMYQRDGILLDDDHYLASKTFLSVRKFRKLKTELLDESKLFVRDGLLMNVKTQKELDLINEKSVKNAEAAKIKARKYAEKRQKKQAKSLNDNGPTSAGAEKEAEKSAEKDAAKSCHTGEAGEQVIQEKVSSSVSTSETHPEKAKATAPDASALDYLSFGTELSEIAVLPSKISFTPVRKWLEAGIDKDLIRRVVKNKSATQRAAARPIKSFKYFHDAILEAHALATHKPATSSKLAERPEDWEQEDDNDDL